VSTSTLGLEVDVQGSSLALVALPYSGFRLCHIENFACYDDGGERQGRTDSDIVLRGKDTAGSFDDKKSLKRKSVKV
jgi:hypothetical protein